MDVKNVFLNGTLSKEVYMKPPSGTFPPPQKVCLLRRALYGLKQAPQAWFATFISIVTQLGFTLSPHDTTSHVKLQRVLCFSSFMLMI